MLATNYVLLKDAISYGNKKTIKNDNKRIAAIRKDLVKYSLNQTWEEDERFEKALLEKSEKITGKHRVIKLIYWAVKNLTGGPIVKVSTPDELINILQDYDYDEMDRVILMVNSIYGSSFQF